MGPAFLLLVRKRMSERTSEVAKSVRTPAATVPAADRRAVKLGPPPWVRWQSRRQGMDGGQGSRGWPNRPDGDGQKGARALPRRWGAVRQTLIGRAAELPGFQPVASLSAS